MHASNGLLGNSTSAPPKAVAVPHLVATGIPSRACGPHRHCRAWPVPLETPRPAARPPTETEQRSSSDLMLIFKHTLSDGRVKDELSNMYQGKE